MERLSLEVRTLLSRMLEVEEDTRIEWSELFTSPLFSFDIMAKEICHKFEELDKTPTF
jgi:hypothetical protein